MCNIDSANLFLCQILYCSVFEALRIFSIRKNNLPDVLISPVRLWFYIRRIFKAADVYFWQLLSFNDFPAPATLQKTDKCILFPSFKFRDEHQDWVQSECLAWVQTCLSMADLWRVPFQVTESLGRLLCFSSFKWNGFKGLAYTSII